MIISLSEIIPNARNSIKSGIGLRTFGISTTIFKYEYDLVGATIRTDNVLTGLETFSETDFISALYKYFSSDSLRIYKVLFALVS